MSQPLADRMRPQTAAELVGQQHLLESGKPLRRALDTRRPHSMILWGPPGCGKTTIAQVAAATAAAAFIPLSAVLSGVADIRKAIQAAENNRQLKQDTVLFVDEVHRFNKAQQDAFLPHVESGLITFIGATTENPSFALNNALLSRAQVYVLKPLQENDLKALLLRALDDDERGLGGEGVAVSDEAVTALAIGADGDARRALGFLELAAQLANGEIDLSVVAQVTAASARRFDRGGDIFYDQISALHKSVRSSDPDAALYWLARMLDGGCDPNYIARRIVRMASEDLGNADPRALQIALDAWSAFERLGSPEGELALGQAVAYLACAPKSNAVYEAYKAALGDAKGAGSLEVPMHLRNAPTKLMKELGHGDGYQYDHDHIDGVALEQPCLPDALKNRRYYEPVERGLEIKIKQRLDQLRELRGKR